MILNLPKGTMVIALVALALTVGADDRVTQKQAGDRRSQPLKDPYAPSNTVVRPPYGQTVPTRPTVNPIPPTQYRARNKRFTITGIQAIGVARRHGYIFTGDEKCRFNGSTGWIVQPDANQGRYCRMDGLIAPRGKSKCRQLRAGWRLEDVQFDQQFQWMVPPASDDVGFRLTKDNTTRGPQMIQIRRMVLTGPDVSGGFENAFSHCSDPNY